MEKKVFLVGHCLLDSSYLTAAVRDVVPDCTVSVVNDENRLASVLNLAPDLLMINRQLDGLFSTFSGIDLIQRIRQTHPKAILMLISNYADAQAQAVAAGAVPGFGKSELSETKMREALVSALAHPKL